MTKLHDLYELHRQSPWLDNLRRDYLRSSHLADLISQGIRGVTSNPTIFAKAIEGGSDYDDQFSQLLAKRSVQDAYWEMVIDDIEGALDLLTPVHRSSGGEDGFVSIEVAPALAYDTAATIAAARYLHQRIDRPNLYVKIPGTSEGIPAIRQMIAEGRNINITLLFSIERYEEVIDAYIGGLRDYLEAGTRDLSNVRSVASFFVSRVDTEVDRRLEVLAGQTDAKHADELHNARGTAAVAQAREAYQLFLRKFSGPSWEELASRGANLQRPLWASTSTKNPEYPDLTYVDALIGPSSVNTMPDQTVDAFLNHGSLRRTIDEDPDSSRRALSHLGELGIDMGDVGRTLEEEGVAAFSKSFDELVQVLSDKANALSADSSSEGS